MKAKEFLRLFEYEDMSKRHDVIMQRATSPAGHAHNDYSHSRPLFDALAHGFSSIEADTRLRNGRLFIAHDVKDIVPSRTLQSIYLEPLAEQIEKNGGSVYGDDRPLTLLIDVKTNAEETYLVLHQILRRFQSILTVYNRQNIQQGAIDVIVSGNRNRRLMETQDVRYATYDGQPSDLGFGSPISFISLISDEWASHFTWNGDGSMPRQERTKLNRIVAAAHAAGQRVRFWATPDEPGRRRDAVWRVLVDAGVDLINTDDFAGLERFFDEIRPQSRRFAGGKLRNPKSL